MRFTALALSISHHELIRLIVCLQLKAGGIRQLRSAGIVGHSEQSLALVGHIRGFMSANEFYDGNRGSECLGDQGATFGVLTERR